MNDKTNKKLKRVWVATDKQGEQNVFNKKPALNENGDEWLTVDLCDDYEGNFLELESKVLPNQTHEDEPVEFELAPVGIAEGQAGIIKKQRITIERFREYQSEHHMASCECSGCMGTL